MDNLTKKFPRAAAFLMGHSDGFIGLDSNPEKMLPVHRHRQWTNQMDYWYAQGHETGLEGLRQWWLRRWFPS